MAPDTLLQDWEYFSGFVSTLVQPLLVSLVISHLHVMEITELLTEWF